MRIEYGHFLRFAMQLLITENLPFRLLHSRRVARRALRVHLRNSSLPGSGRVTGYSEVES